MPEGKSKVAAPLFKSYVQLARSLVPTIEGVALLDQSLQVIGVTRGMPAAQCGRWLKDSPNTQDPSARFRALDGSRVSMLTLEDSQGIFMGAFCVTQTIETFMPPAKHLGMLRKTLGPLLECVHRDLSASGSNRSGQRAFTERSAQLEWLFQLSGDLRGASDGRGLLERLILAASERLEANLGAIYIPDKRLCVEQGVGEALQESRDAWRRARAHVLAWAQRQHRPLVVNRVGRPSQGLPVCKIMAVPVVRENGFVIGVLGFLRASTGPDFANKHLFLARHLGRQAGHLVERQFDLMTGLYTRAALDESFASLLADSALEHTLIYLDVDQLHVVNELHGFELGNELIVRVADLMSPPLVPERARAMRIESDRFAVVIPSCGVDEAVRIAQTLVDAASKIVLGPAEQPIEVSVSAGIAPILDSPPLLQRALSAAELACKTAKNRGRRRVEVYTFDDDSMMRRHVDVVAVGRLREVLRGDRFLLYAQRIASLQGSEYTGYELLLRIRNPDGSVSSAAELIDAAGRYQLLPTIDRWVTKRALEMLTPYRAVLASRGIGIAINISGPSLCDEALVGQLMGQLKEARLPADCLTVEITEQAAVSNLARANALITELKACGCQFALDDFGTGANSLTTLNSLQISRIKIDGSFVRHVATDRSAHSTVRAIVELAQGLSIDTVAEFVETKDIAAELKQLGVDYAQGYAFGHPEPLQDVLKALNEDESRRLHRLYLES
jgi:diguanylate cyclase (GGDEF)-like protein